MKSFDNQYRIYIKSTREWVEVPEETYKEHIRYFDTFRKRQQSRGECACPKSRFWLCDGDCLTCEFHHTSMDSSITPSKAMAVIPIPLLTSSVIHRRPSKALSATRSNLIGSLPG